jgi:Zn/Cd-binding protein ZinT
MALPRYQQTGLLIGDTPRLDFANLQEAARGAQTVSASLDRISQFAFGQAQKQQREENQILGIQMRAELESEVQKQISELDVQVSTGQLSNFDEIQERVQAMKGYARELYGVDVEQANGLMRSISVSGNALLKKSADLIVNAYGTQVDVKTDETIGNLQSNLEMLYRYEQDPELIAQYEAGARGIAFGLAAQNPKNIEKKMQSFEEARVAARDNAFVDYFKSNEFSAQPSEALMKLRAGDAGRYSPIWDAMGQDQREKVVQRMIKRTADDLLVLQNERKVKEEIVRVDNSLDYDKFYSGEIGGNQLIANMRARGYTPGREEISAIRSGDSSGGSLQLFGTLESRARRGQLSEDQATSMAKSQSISWKQRNDLLKIINGSERGDISRAKEFIANSFVPNPLDPTTKRSYEVKADVTNQLLIKATEAEKAGKPFDAMAEAETLVSKRLEQNDMKALAAAKETLKIRLQKAGLEYSEDYTDETLRRAGVSNAKVRKSIMDSVRAVGSQK